MVQPVQMSQPAKKTSNRMMSPMRPQRADSFQIKRH
jgi:hypothetical protein